MDDTPLKVQLEEAGRVLRLTLARPRKNIIDAAMISALRSALAEYRQQQQLVAALIDAEGPNFSFGASVEEHLPEQCAGMLKAINGMILEMLSWPLPVLVAVRGQCLGGGMEVVQALVRPGICTTSLSPFTCRLPGRS